MRFLPCHHWYCSLCITKLIDTSDNSGSFLCPNCRVGVLIPAGKVDDFPVAFIINQLRDAVAEQRKRFPSGKSTCVDHKKDLVLYCETCSDYICTKCVTHHSSIGHAILDADEVKERNEKPLLEVKGDLIEKVFYYEGRLDELSKAKAKSDVLVNENRSNIETFRNRLIEQIYSFIEHLLEKIDKVHTNIMVEYKKLEKTMLGDMSSLKDSIEQIDIILHENYPGMRGPESYKLLLENLPARVDIPEMIIKPHLPDIGQLTETLMGILACDGERKDVTKVSKASAH